MTFQEPDDDNVDDFLAELDRTLKPVKGSASKTKRAPVSYAGEAVVQQWFPHSIELHTCTQQCRCGSFAGGVTGLFEVSIHRNGATHARRVETITPEFAALPRVIQETTELISYCPNCWEGGTILSTPKGDPK